jgi:hypothetical protein
MNQEEKSMGTWRELFLRVAFLALTCVSAWGQGSPPQVLPIPIPLGDVFLPAQPILSGGVLTEQTQK